MGWLFALVAVVCGVVILIHMPTGDLKTDQIIGIGLICAGAAYLAGGTAPAWPWNHP